MGLTLFLASGSVRKDEFELLCVDGTRRPVDDYIHCNWGRAPSHAIVTTSAKSGEQRRLYQRFLKVSSVDIRRYSFIKINFVPTMLNYCFFLAESSSALRKLLQRN